MKLLQDAGLRLHFVFNGLDSGIGSDSFTSSTRAAKLGDEAFTLYETQQAKQAIDVFRASGMLWSVVNIEICVKWFIRSMSSIDSLRDLEEDPS